MLDAQVAFLGVPYDGGTPEPGIPTGQRAGPAAAREASRDQFYYPRSAGAGDDRGAEGWYDVEADRDYLVGVTMADVGDVAIQGSDTEGTTGGSWALRESWKRSKSRLTGREPFRPVRHHFGITSFGINAWTRYAGLIGCQSWMRLPSGSRTSAKRPFG
jgi:hypothetical protein